jgi:hypothetical protein
MNRKTLLISLLAVAGAVLLVAASAVTVFALIDSSASQVDQVSLDKAVEVAPVQVKPVSHSEVVKPVRQYEHAGYAGKSGCPYSSEVQITEAPAKQIEQEPLAQVQR